MNKVKSAKFDKEAIASGGTVKVTVEYTVTRDRTIDVVAADTDELEVKPKTISAPKGQSEAEAELTLTRKDGATAGALYKVVFSIANGPKVRPSLTVN